MLLPRRDRGHACAGWIGDSNSHRDGRVHCDPIASDPDTKPFDPFCDSLQYAYHHPFADQHFHTDHDRVCNRHMDCNVDTDRVTDLHTVIYTILYTYSIRNLHTDPELYPGHTVEYTHTNHHFIPQPIT